jgi:hypothetical protein
MAINIVTIRDGGDKEGPEIFDPLLSTVTAALARGAQEINASTPIEPVSLEVVYRPGLHKGNLIEVSDSLSGDSWRGQIISVANVFNGPVLFSKLEVERLV